MSLFQNVMDALSGNYLTFVLNHQFNRYYIIVVNSQHI